MRVRMHTNGRSPCRGRNERVPCMPIGKIPVHVLDECAKLCHLQKVDSNHLSPQALYDHLMDFLADRGVDNTFADELIALSTALEHKEYIQFLEDLKQFVKCQ